MSENVESINAARMRCFQNLQAGWRVSSGSVDREDILTVFGPNAFGSIEQQTCDHVIGFDLDEHLHRASNRPAIDPEIIFNYCPTCGARLETV